jgi:hypothetical protein
VNLAAFAIATSLSYSLSKHFHDLISLHLVALPFHSIKDTFDNIDVCCFLFHSNSVILCSWNEHSQTEVVIDGDS